jgi:hypothetical protein
MTDDEADALDELWTHTTISHHSLSEIIGEMVKKEMSVSTSV